MSPTTPRCAGGPSSSPFCAHHPPSALPLGLDGIPSSASCYSPAPAPPPSPPPPPPPPPDRFDTILDACGLISPSQDGLLRGSPFIGQENADDEGLTDHVLYRIFSGSAKPSKIGRPSDADAAELALASYFLRIGPGRLHLIHQHQRQEGKEDVRTQFPSGPPEADEKRPEGMSPQAEASPTCLLEAAAATLTTSSESAEEKAAVLMRGGPDSPRRSRSPSSTVDERSAVSKKPCVGPNAANPSAGTCSPDAGVISTGDMPSVTDEPPSSYLRGQGSRKLPPSILCPVNWEERGIGEEGGTRLRLRRPPMQVEQEAAGKAPTAGADVNAPSLSSPADWSLPAEDTRMASSADVAGVEEQGLDEGETNGPPPWSPAAVVEKSPPSEGAAMQSLYPPSSMSC